MKLTRRQFVQGCGTVGGGLVAGCAPWPGRGLDTRSRLRPVGVLIQGRPDGPDALVDGFHQGLSDHGLENGRSIMLEYRYADGNSSVLPDLATELVAVPVDLIVAVGALASAAAKNATGKVPVIMLGIANPVGQGLVASLAHPGGHVTGVSTDTGPELMGKRVQLLQETIPSLTRLAVLWNPEEPNSPANWAALHQATATLGITVLTITVHDASELDHVFEAIARENWHAALTVGGPFFFRHRAQVAALAIEHRIPMMQPRNESVEAGGLMSYGPSWFELSRRGGHYVKKVLAGENPGDLPVEQPTVLHLAINLRTAQALGLTIPPSVLLQATEVIQ